MRFDRLNNTEKYNFIQNLRDAPVLPLMVHPFYNLLINPQSYHARDYSLAKRELLARVQRGIKGETGSFLKELPKSLFSNDELRDAEKLNITLSSHFKLLASFMATTTFPAIMIFETLKNLDTTELIIRDLGYTGETIFVPTVDEAASPINGVTFRDLARFFITTQLEEILISGQNLWVGNKYQDGDVVDLPGKFILDPKTTDSEPPLHGCVGEAFLGLFKEFRLLGISIPQANIPKLELHDAVWPQRRSTDPSTRERKQRE